MLKPYENLTKDQKEEARKEHPKDYREWVYWFDGVSLRFSAK